MQLELSKKPKSFFRTFLPFLKFPSNFENFEKKDEPHSLCSSKIRDCEKHALLNVSTTLFENTIRQSTC